MESRVSSPPLPDESQGPLILGVLLFTFVISTVTILLRFYTRIKRHVHGWDDYTIYIAWLISCGSVVVGVRSVESGLGRHAIYLNPEEQHDVRMWLTIGKYFVGVGYGFIRLSVCLFIMRLLRGTHRKSRYTLYTIMVLNVILITVTLLLQTLQCMPIQKIWDPQLEGRCFGSEHITRIIRVTGVLGCVMDFACIAVCFLALRHLQMNRKTKFGILFLMSLGVLTAACSIGRTVTTQQRIYDFSWQNVAVFIWAGEELHLGVFVACLPTMHPIMSDASQAVMASWRSISSRSSRSKSHASDSETGIATDSVVSKRVDVEVQFETKE